MKKLTRIQLDRFLKKYATTDRILDLGSGGSTYDSYFPNRLTVDIDPARGPQVVADAHHLPFEDNQFSTILCTEMLEHVQDPAQVVAEMARVLAPGGQVILTTRFVYPLHDVPHDYWRFTKYGLLHLFRHWQVVELQAELPTFSAIAALVQRVILQTTLRWNKVTKALLLPVVYLLDHLNFLVVTEYGDIKKSTTDSHIMTTGYYIVCKKP